MAGTETETKSGGKVLDWDGVGTKQKDVAEPI